METQDEKTPPAAPTRSLKDAMRKARMAQAERTDVIVDLRTAEVTRLELLQEELVGIFAQMEGSETQFELALSQGQTPRLWIDMLAFVAMSRDRRTYRFLRDTRSGRQVLAESDEPKTIANVVLDYVAHQLIEREKAMAETPFMPHAAATSPKTATPGTSPAPGGGGWRIFFAFLLGAAVSAAGLLGYAYLNVP